jgi:phosphoribosyl 1,2-cyclic phosphate phosphodiesterase
MCSSSPRAAPYPPILTLHLIEGEVTVTGAGGAITFVADPSPGTAYIDALGFRIGPLAYLPDASRSPRRAGRCSRGWTPGWWTRCGASRTPRMRIWR